MSKRLERLENLKNFLGRRVIALYLISFLAGVAWFGVESSFVLVLQGFLVSLGLVTTGQTFLPSWYPHTLEMSVFFLVAFGFLRAILFSFKYFLSEVTTQAFVRHQRGIILNYALNFAHLEPGHTILSLFNERLAQAGAILQQLSLLFNAGISFILFFILGLRMSANELLIGLFLLILLMAPFHFLEGRIRKLGKETVEFGDRVMETLAVGMKNYFYLKMYSLVRGEVDKGKEYLRLYERKNRSFLMISAFRSAYPQFIGVLVIGVLSYLGVFYFKTPGMVLLSLFYIFLRLAQGASDINSSIGQIRYSYDGFKLLYSWSSKARSVLHLLDIREATPSVELTDAHVRIKASDLAFGYDSNQEIFENINFEIGPSELLLIKGPSGSGKSSLVALIVGLLDPRKGQILVNGQPILKVRNALLKKVAYVGPEPYLIAASIRGNLLYGHPAPNSIKEADLWDVLQRTALDKVVHTFAKGLDEKLLESAQLSTGQKQRLATARALLRKPQLLILDEATANLDTETEAKLLQTFQDLGRNITIIVVSHRSSFDALATHQILLLGERIEINA